MDSAPITRFDPSPIARRLLGKLRKVRKDASDVEAIHDARVAARRLLAVGEMWFRAADGWTQLRKRLPKLVRRLGRVRNFDVTLELVADGPATDAATRAGLRRALRTWRRRRRKRLRAWLTSDRVRSLAARIDDVVAVLGPLPDGAEPGPRDLAVHFERLAELMADETWTADAVRAHEVRREVRGLRYAFESVGDAYLPAERKRAAAALKNVQEVAGAWQDRAIAAKLARKAVDAGRVDVSLAPLLARWDDESAELSLRFTAAVRALVALRNTLLGLSVPDAAAAGRRRTNAGRRRPRGSPAAPPRGSSPRPRSPARRR